MILYFEQHLEQQTPGVSRMKQCSMRSKKWHRLSLSWKEEANTWNISSPPSAPAFLFITKLVCYRTPVYSWTRDSWVWNGETVYRYIHRQLERRDKLDLLYFYATLEEEMKPGFLLLCLFMRSHLGKCPQGTKKLNPTYDNYMVCMAFDVPWRP